MRVAAFSKVERVKRLKVEFQFKLILNFLNKGLLLVLD